MEIRYCKKCQAETQNIVRERPDTPHAGEYRCAECGSHNGWKKKEKNEGRREKNKHTPESLDIHECQLCRRPKEYLGTNETLTSHHVEEIAKGGQDVPENIWVLCSPCHSLVHHQRTYLNDHMQNMWQKYEELKRILQESGIDPASYRKAVDNLTEQLGI